MLTNKSKSFCRWGLERTKQQLHSSQFVFLYSPVVTLLNPRTDQELSEADLTPDNLLITAFCLLTLVLDSGNDLSGDITMLIICYKPHRDPWPREKNRKRICTDIRSAYRCMSTEPKYSANHKRGHQSIQHPNWLRNNYRTCLPSLN